MHLKHFKINQCLRVLLLSIKISYCFVAFEEVENIKSVLNIFWLYTVLWNLKKKIPSSLFNSFKNTTQKAHTFRFGGVRSQTVGALTCVWRMHISSTQTGAPRDDWRLQESCSSEFSWCLGSQPHLKWRTNPVSGKSGLLDCSSLSLPLGGRNGQAFPWYFIPPHLPFPIPTGSVLPFS